MSLVVQKVGGPSFADPERSKGVAQRVVATGSDPREQDRALTAGEVCKVGE